MARAQPPWIGDRFVTLALVDIRIRLRGRTLFDGLSVSAAAGQATTIMGPSGSGKSSLLGFACGTLPRDFLCSGRVLLNGEDIGALPAHRRRLGILFQDDLLFPHMSVGDNLAFGLDPAVRGRHARRERVDAALREAELPGFADRDPATLSGGQRARVALMRVLLAAPRALLLDEPFGRLDAALRDRFRRFVLDAAASRGLPVLLVTHDAADAAAAEGPVLQLD